MRLKIAFGYKSIEKIVDWNRDVTDFPKLIKFDGRRWEWVTYNSPDGLTYELVFSQIPTFDPNFYADMPDFETMFPNSEIKCECGARFSSFGFDHMRMCKLWRPW